MMFSDVETYLEFIAGIKDSNGKATGKFWASPVIQLANYDVGFITSIVEQLSAGTALSDRQSVLALKIIDKYARQLRKHNVEQPNHTHHRLGIRQLDRASKAYLTADKKIALKFPFNEEMIAAVKSFAKDSQGAVQWQPDSKEWQLALTEYNLSWAYAFASAKNMQIDASVAELFQLILDAEQTPYSIELRVSGDKCEITNAPQSMVDYINQNIGFDNLYALVDNAGVLGYTIDQTIVDLLTAENGETFIKLCATQAIDIPPGQNIDDILAWAKAVNRFPMVVFNPNFIKTDIESYKRHFGEDEIQTILRKTDSSTESFILDPKTKVVYTNFVLPDWEGRIPLLITHANLMHGATKRSFLQKADKIVYYVEKLPR